MIDLSNLTRLRANTILRRVHTRAASNAALVDTLVVGRMRIRNARKQNGANRKLRKDRGRRYQLSINGTGNSFLNRHDLPSVSTFYKRRRNAACRRVLIPHLRNRADIDEHAHAARSEWVIGIRGIVKDPATAELLCPSNVFGCKRLCVDTGYFETYNLPHVKLVDVSKTPIERFTADGIEVDGTEYPLDAIVSATGFAAMTGSFDKIKITGRNGQTLAEKWRAGPRAYLGVATVGFPNLFTITGPGSPSVLASMIQAIEQHVDWMADCMAHLRDLGAATIEPMQHDEDDWVEHVNEVSKVSLRSTCSSWYVGANIAGRPRVFMPYIGGFPIYVQKCNEVMSNGFEGFVIDGADPRNEAPRVRLTERWRVPLDIDVISPAAVAARRVPVV